ncbi:IPT/TIG domain-containing protein [Cupriavidus necator]|uniref:IPT/TIG domain-containing protein n=1 Tax=Cupriavidus necator TaxID=106590 RepID=UPI0039C0C7F8
MAALLDSVRPGDVITSDLINRIIDLLNEHDALLAASSGGSLSITGVQPQVVRMGEELKVLGSGLSPPTLKRVSIDGVDVPPASLSGTDSTLTFIVPPVLGIPDLGQTVTLTVENLGGTADTVTFFLLPGLPSNLEATFNITRTTVTPAGALAANTSYEFTYSIETFSSRNETYFLEPKLLSPSPGWSVTVKGGQNEIFIPKSQPAPSSMPVVLVVTTGPAGGASVTLGLRSKNFSGVTGSSVADPVSIGATPGAPNLDVEFLSPTVLGSVQKFSNGSLYIRTDANVANQKATVNPLNVRLKTPGIYTIGTPVVGNPAWTVTVMNSPLTLDTTGTPNAIKGLIFTVQGAAGAPDADIEIPVTGAGALPDGSFKFKAKLRPDPSNPSPI